MSRLSGAKFGGLYENSKPSSNVSNGKSQNDAVKNASSVKVDPNDYVPKRFGLKYEPPAIIMEYLIPSSGKLYHHKLKIAHLKSDSETMEIVEGVKKKHNQYFVGNKISDSQIKTLVEKLKKHAPTSHGVINKGDNKKLGDLNTGKLSSGLYEKQNNSTKPLQNGKDKNNGNNFWDFGEDENDEEVDYQNANLNKLSKEELQKHKDKMSVLFNKNNKKPGDAGFIYDKQESFVPQEDNEWDDEDDF